MVSKVYFAKDGLTSTSANYICNLAKEYYKKFETTLVQIKFYDTTVSLIGTSNDMIISTGINGEALKAISSMIQAIAECKSLIAWLREAIKARDELRKELDCTTIEKWAELNNITLPEKPVLETVLTAEEYYASLSIKDMNRYYYLESVCAEIGKYIHENGILNKEKEDMVKKSHAPYSTSGSGRDMTVTKYKLTCSIEDVENEYFALQNKHREFQAQLNAMKFECEKAIQQSTSKANGKYTEECALYSNKMREYEAQFKEWKFTADTEIQNLKIIIPEHLKEIYNKIKSLGK